MGITARNRALAVLVSSVASALVACGAATDVAAPGSAGASAAGASGLASAGATTSAGSAGAAYGGAGAGGATTASTSGAGGVVSAGSAGALGGGAGGFSTGGAAGAAGSNGGAAGSAGAAASTPLQLGILPDYDNAKSNTNGIAGFVARTSVVPFLASDYMNISGGTFNTNQAKSFIDEAHAAGVKCAAISLATADSDVPSGAQAQIAAAVSYGVQKAMIVQVRFGYEMNGNWSPSYHGGDFTIFKNTWAKVASAVRGAGGQMVWAPNIDSGGMQAYKAVLPSDPSTIDVVGLDFYHFNSSETNLNVSPDEVDKAFASIYPIVNDLAKPFMLTETAISYFVTSGAWPDATADEIAEKLTWLKQLTSPALRAKYPLYRGFAWFDYNKHESNEYRDFSISQQPSEATMFTAWVADNRSALSLGG